MSEGIKDERKVEALKFPLMNKKIIESIENMSFSQWISEKSSFDMKKISWELMSSSILSPIVTPKIKTNKNSRFSSLNKNIFHSRKIQLRQNSIKLAKKIQFQCENIDVSLEIMHLNVAST